jgi:hypothetical protein
MERKDSLRVKRARQWIERQHKNDGIVLKATFGLIASDLAKLVNYKPSFFRTLGLACSSVRRAYEQS